MEKNVLKNSKKGLLPYYKTMAAISTDNEFLSWVDSVEAISYLSLP